MDLLQIYSTSKPSTHHRLLLWHMANNRVPEAYNNKKTAQFQVGHMSYPGLNKHMAFKD